MHDTLVDAVLHERPLEIAARETPQVRLVFREQDLGNCARIALHVPPALAERLVLCLDGREAGARRERQLGESRMPRDVRPAPRVAEPQRRQQVQRRLLRAAIRRRDADQDVVAGALRVLDLHVVVPAVVEDAGVRELELHPRAAARGVLLHDLRIRERVDRILVEELHIRMRRRRVEVEVVLLHVLAVISLVATEAEEALLQDRVAAVPHRDGEAQALVVVADAADPVLAPAVRSRSRMVVGEVVPRRAVIAVILAHRAPLAVGEVRPPAPPVGRLARRFCETAIFGRGSFQVRHDKDRPPAAIPRRAPAEIPSGAWRNRRPPSGDPAAIRP